MLDAICKELNNWFCNSDDDKHFDTYTIADGVLQLSFLQSNQYFRIVGSVFNDGVYKYGENGSVSQLTKSGLVATTLTDETFEGSIWAMKVPRDVVTLATEIATWVNTYESEINSPYTSESFGGYSYSKKSGANGESYSWQDNFRRRLNSWRKI